MSDCLIQRFPASIERLASVIFWIIGRFHAVVTNIGVQPTGQITEHAAVGQKAAQLLDKYGNSILRLAYSYLHNMSDAEDILQDTLLQYLKTAPVLENETHEKAWLLRVAANLSQVKKLAQHSNSIFAICNSTLLLLH